MLKFLGVPLAGFLLWGCNSTTTISEPPTKIIPPLVCVRLDSYKDVDALRHEGHTVDYRNERWFVDGKVAGYASDEDVATTVCFENLEVK